MFKRICSCFFNLFRKHDVIPTSPSSIDLILGLVASYPNYVLYLFEIFIHYKEKYYLIRSTGYILQHTLSKILEDYENCTIVKVYNVTKGEMLYTSNMLILDEVNTIDLNHYL